MQHAISINGVKKFLARFHNPWVHTYGKRLLLTAYSPMQPNRMIIAMKATPKLVMNHRIKDCRPFPK